MKFTRQKKKKITVPFIQQWTRPHAQPENSPRIKTKWQTEVQIRGEADGRTVGQTDGQTDGLTDLGSGNLVYYAARACLKEWADSRAHYSNLADIYKSLWISRGICCFPWNTLFSHHSDPISVSKMYWDLESIAVFFPSTLSSVVFVLIRSSIKKNIDVI